MQSTARSGLAQDLALASVCAVALVVLLAYIFNPARAGDLPIRDDIPPLGILVVGERDVRHRVDGTLVWNEMRRGEQVHDGDGIYVGEGGSALVIMKSGAHLEIEDRSMVVLHPTRSGYDPNAAIDLRWGGASGVALGGPLAIRTRGAQVQVEDGGRASVRVQEDNSLAVTVPQGSASLRLEHGQPVSMGALDKRVVDLQHDHVGPLERLATSLTAPSNAERIFVHDGGQNVDFSWQPVPKATGYTWELAHDGGFAHVLAAQQTHETAVRYAGLAPGAYHWRVRVALGKGTSVSEDRTVMLVDDHAPTPLTPSSDGVVDVSRHADITLGWTPVVGVGHYQVALSDVKGAGVQSWRSAYAGLTVNAARLEEGTYCYRVRADEPERGDSPWSKPHCFRIITHPVLKAPKLLEPAPAHGPSPGTHKQGWLWRLVGGVAYAEEAPSSAVVLRWEVLEGAVGYALEVATDGGMEHVVARMRVADPFYRWQPPEPRLYYWRVRGVDADGREGEPSVVELLDARPPAAVLASPPTVVSPPLKMPPAPPIVAPAPKPRPGRPSAQAGKAVSVPPVGTNPVPALAPPPAAAQAPVRAPKATGAMEPITLDLAPPFTPSGWVGARLGFFANFGGITTVQPGLEVGAWVANTWQTQFGIRLGADYQTASVSAASPDGLVQVSSRLQRVPITLSGMGFWPFRWVDVTAALGLRAAWTYVAQGIKGEPSRSDSTMEWGGVFAAGVQRVLGPGALFAELAYDVTSQESSLANDAPDGLELALGYRLRVF